MRCVYIGVGSNLGDRVEHLAAAMAAVRCALDPQARMSRIFETEPRLDEHQPPFLNAVIAARTDLDPHGVLDVLLGIEQSLGRSRAQDRPKGPRTIDLDVLLCGEHVIDTDRLTLPHPGLSLRRFVLAPLVDVEPDLHIDGLGDVRRLLADCPDEGWVRPVKPAPAPASVPAAVAVLGVLLCLCAACDLRPPVERAAGVDFDQAVRAPFRAPERAAAPPAPDGGKDNEVIDILVDKRKELFERPESTVLTQAEALAARSGRQFDMIDIYRKTYDEKGAGHYVAPRLAYAYINIGLNDAARKIVDQMMIARPDDWRTWFIHGWLRGTENKDPESAIVETLDAWQKALDIGVVEQELYGVSREFIEKRVTEARAMLERTGKSPASKPAARTQAELLAEAEALLAADNAKAAFMAFARLVDKDPKDTHAAVGRAVAGWKAIGAEDPAAGLGLLDKVAEREDLNAVELDRLGAAFLDGPKDKERAKAVWSRVLAQFPDYAESVDLQERLQGL